jgi:carboxyl-terminal processing protease
MSRRDWTRVALVVVLVLLIVIASGGVGFAAGWYLNSQGTPPASAGSHPELQQGFRTFWETWDILDREFNRQGPLDTQKMIYGAIAGMVRAVGDPYTMFMEPTQARYFDQDLQGSFEGIGATLETVDGQLVVAELIPNSPAAKAGLQPGDVLLKADGKPLQDVTQSEAITIIRGPKGSQVVLQIHRPGQPEPFEVTVTRDTIEMPTVTYRMLDNGIAYVRLAEFNQQAATRLQEALRSLMANKPKGLVFDLRGNPGGYLHIAVQVASEFLRSGTLVVSEKDYDGKSSEYKAEAGGLALDVPLVVLVDGGSASAAEIVAAAIQETGRGILVGRTSFGKGSVQTTHTFGDGSALHVTVARWYTPKGKQLDGKGLTPEIAVPADQDTSTTGQDAVLQRAAQYLLSLPAKP